MEQTTTKWYPSKWMVLFLIWVAYFLNQADRQAFNVVLPLIQEDLGLAASEMGMIASILTFFFAMMVPLGGWLGDLVSRKWLLSLCIIFWSVATMFTGVATSFVTLVLIRCISMGGEAIFGPNYLPMLSEYHSKTRAIAMALVQVAYYLGIIASGWLAGYIGQTYGWKATFIVFGAVGLLHGLLMVLFLRDKRKLATESAAQGAPTKKVSLLDGFRIIHHTDRTLCDDWFRRPLVCRCGLPHLDAGISSRELPNATLRCRFPLDALDSLLCSCGRVACRPFGRYVRHKTLGVAYVPAGYRSYRCRTIHYAYGQRHGDVVGMRWLGGLRLLPCLL